MNATAQTEVTDADIAALRTESDGDLMGAKQQIVDAITELVRLLRGADDGILDAAHCELARRACASQYASTHEPLVGACVMLAAEALRRTI
jgi:hypothetical protein